MSISISPKVTTADFLGAGWVRMEHSAKPGEQFAAAEGLGEIVVCGAGVERTDLVLLAVPHSSSTRTGICDHSRSRRSTAVPSMSGRPRSRTTPSDTPDAGRGIQAQLCPVSASATHGSRPTRA